MSYVYFITADGRSSKAFDHYQDALEALAYISESDPELRPQLVAVDEVQAGTYLRQPLLTPTTLRYAEEILR